MARESFDFPKSSSAETWECWSSFPKPSERKRQKEKNRLPNDSISLLKVTNVVVSSVLLWRASLLIWYVPTKNHWYLECYQCKMNPSFLRGIYIKIKLFHPPIVNNTATYSFYSLGFLSLFKIVIQYNTLDLNKLFLDKNKEPVIVWCQK